MNFVQWTWQASDATMGVSFCLRLKKCLARENLIGQRLDRLGIVPGTSLYFHYCEGYKNQTESRV